MVAQLGAGCGAEGLKPREQSGAMAVVLEEDMNLEWGTATGTQRRQGPWETSGDNVRWVRRGVLSDIRFLAPEPGGS